MCEAGDWAPDPRPPPPGSVLLLLMLACLSPKWVVLSVKAVGDKVCRQGGNTHVQGALAASDLNVLDGESRARLDAGGFILTVGLQVGELRGNRHVGSERNAHYKR